MAISANESSRLPSLYKNELFINTEKQVPNTIQLQLIRPGLHQNIKTTVMPIIWMLS